MTDYLEHDDEHIPVDDNYKRTKSIVTAGTAASDVVEENVSAELAELLRLDDDERWAAHDAKVAAEQRRAEDRDRADEHRRRATALKGDEHRFPAIAVDAALAVWPGDSPAMTAVRRYAKAPQMLLVLAGGVGTGKSTAATWAALEVGGFSPVFLRANELEARGRYDKELRTWLRTRSMLVLDDLGAEVLDGKNVFRSLLDEVVDTFYGDRKRLVVTTNLLKQRETVGDGVVKFSEPQFVERYGERITSRFSQSGLWFDCGAHDLRRDLVLRP